MKMLFENAIEPKLGGKKIGELANGAMGPDMFKLAHDLFYSRALPGFITMRDAECRRILETPSRVLQLTDT